MALRVKVIGTFAPALDHTSEARSQTLFFEASVSAIRALTRVVTRSAGRGWSPWNRMVPLEVSYPSTRWAWASITAGLWT